ncbi:TrkH family potassium uptake protein [Zhouia sp. PK063]|uniref:TrkH family potassium uptake protein n=1 Tax=Zhouia sp. PK063 TaxID=3373602 RepID=UPI00378A7A06
MKKIKIIRPLLIIVDFIIVSLLVFDFGFKLFENFRVHKIVSIFILVLTLLLFNVYRYFHQRDRVKRLISLTYSALFTIVLVLCLFIYIFSPEYVLTDFLVTIKPFLEGALMLYLILRLSIFMRYLYSIYFNPAIIFVGSFLIIDMVGAFLLMLPNATTNGITFVDALFTSTSAVCVTGLAVLDTSKDFTHLGQSIILLLIQLGGLGILTFTSFFAYFFRSGSSFKENLYLQDFVSSENLKDTLNFAMKIVVFTLSIEAIGFIFIYFTVDQIGSIKDRLFFSLFHSISAFCNAGFSTMSNGLFNTDLKFDYSFQWIIMLLIIIGGLGNNIVFNIYTYIKRRIQRFIAPHKYTPVVRIVTLNSKIVIVTTIILLLGGFVFFFFNESNNSLLADQSWFGKITNAMFQSVTPRTAGFNTVDYASLKTSSLLFVILLMWIGGSPGSTAGGIKTTTFALATLNIFAVARGKNKIDLGTRSVGTATLTRAFAILCISLIIIGIAIILLLFFEPDKNLISIAFECFSAYCTVGLSLDLTPTLSDASKIVLAVVMFLGRIGMLNILIGLLRQVNTRFYEYPKENILIN